MRYLTEFRDSDTVTHYLRLMEKTLLHPRTIMEVCGSQTHTIVGEGIDQLIPPHLNLVHGPGCPVCVTSVEVIDTAIALAKIENCIICSYGDMLRVPGTTEDLLSVKAGGGDVRIVYSPLDALELARQNPKEKIVFFGIGFETTTPPNAMAVKIADSEQITNFFLLSSHVVVPPALETILSSADCRIEGLLAPGHVCTITGYEAYEPIAAKYQVPIVVTGFEPVDIVEGMYLLINAMEDKNYSVINQYRRCVSRSGNPTAKALMSQIFEPCDQVWRGIGMIPLSGHKLKSAYSKYDARNLLEGQIIDSRESPECQAGEILIGAKKPFQCPAFGTLCTPSRPLGAPMVSSEGACAAYYHAGRKD